MSSEESRPAPRRGRAVTAWVTVGAALLVALLATWAVQRLGAYADARRQMQLLLVDIGGRSAELRREVEQAGQSGAIPPGVEMQIDAQRRELGQQLVTLARLDPGGDAAASVGEAVSDLLLNAMQELRLSATGQTAAARAWAQKRTEPTFELVQETVGSAQLFYSAQADRARRRAILGSAGAIAAEALLIGFLAFVFERSRRSEQLHLAEERTRAEARFRALVQNSFDVVAVLGPTATVEYVSPSIRRMLGIEPEQWQGQTAFDLVHPDDAARAESDLGKVLTRPSERVSNELRLLHADGSWRWVEMTVANSLSDPSLGGIVVNCRDVTERRQLNDQLKHQALHDPLTGLANRALFRNLVQHAIAGSERRGVPAGVLYLDLDGFKQVNDGLGHAAGDQLLNVVAQRLGATLRVEDTAARLGGDEFAVLLDASDLASALQVAERILASLRQAIELRSGEVRIDASIGVAVSSPHIEGSDELIRQADLAMYFAKSEGKGRVRVFEPAMQSRIRRRLELESDLRRALEREEFILHYQPILILASGVLSGVEALLRWRAPDRAGAILPGEFMPLAEETGLIVPIGRWVMNTATRQVRLWQSHFPGEAPLALSINLSAKQFWDVDLIGDVTAALDASGLAPACLTLDITEQVLMRDVDLTLERLLALKKVGVRLAIDDFGGGQSALRHLRRFPIDAIKIDRMFVDSLVSGSPDADLTQGVIELAHRLRLQTVAEGIEGEAQREKLGRMGCELGQGFSLGLPMEPAIIEQLLRGIKPVNPWAGAAPPRRVAVAKAS